MSKSLTKVVGAAGLVFVVLGAAMFVLPGPSLPFLVVGVVLVLVAVMSVASGRSTSR